MTRLALAALLGLAAPLAAAPPNVVMVIGDDQGWGDYSFMGHPHVRTPRLDKLAAEGLTFERGAVATSLCRGSLATMITGLHPHQHKVTSNDPPLPAGKTLRQAMADPAFLALRAEMAGHVERAATLPRLLGAAGYVSHQSGKWWESDACRCGGFTEGMTHGDPARGGRHGDAGLAIGRKGLAEVKRFVDAAAAAKKPFYVWYAPMMPHQPHTPPDRLLAKYRGKTDSPFVAKYWAMCEWFDETVGELLDHLDSAGVAGNTLVVYCVDNGWVQDPKADRFAPRSKNSPYEGGTRTPVVVRWPGKVTPGRSSRPVSTADLAPTVLKAAGVPVPPGLPGVDLLDAAAVAARPAVFGANYTHNAVDVNDPVKNLQYRYAVAGDWKLIVPSATNREATKAELYRVTADPGERDELSARHPETVAGLTKLLDGWWPGR